MGGSGSKPYFETVLVGNDGCEVVSELQVLLPQGIKVYLIALQGIRPCWLRVGTI